ncbi:MAG: GNAT family N-acetyltransferase [Candidatus Jorgensenbacteria bacterium]|nr:GNAT family N-acetyltransferase [Candidatus Jorgensenbacteria bacterium]
MKIFSSETGHNYNTYTFAYANYCVREENDKLSDIYNLGYLPYSGSPEAKNIFYMARSARVPLNSFNMSSENRRVAGKFDGSFERTSTPINQFKTDDDSFLSFCTEYFLKRHGPGVMPLERLKTILNSGIIANIVSYKNKTEPVAYVFEVSDGRMTHFWFSFYDLSLANQSLGTWLMVDSARQAKTRGAEYFYVGTVYGQKALYKTAFENIEYWNGDNWTADIKKIKQLGREDNNRIIGLRDIWKGGLKTFDL